MLDKDILGPSQEIFAGNLKVKNPETFEIFQASIGIVPNSASSELVDLFNDQFDPLRVHVRVGTIGVDSSGQNKYGLFVDVQGVSYYLIKRKKSGEIRYVSDDPRDPVTGELKKKTHKVTVFDVKICETGEAESTS